MKTSASMACKKAPVATPGASLSAEKADAAVNSGSNERTRGNKAIRQTGQNAYLNRKSPQEACG